MDDYGQWSSNFKAKFVENIEYIDHYFNTPVDFSNIDAVNNYESYEYEVLTKNVPPLSLLNIHDQEDFPVDVLGPNGYQMQQFLDQFSINRTEATRRQNLFFGAEKIKDIKVLVINALRIEPHISHFNLEEALQFIDQVNPEVAYITHISH